MLLNRITLLVFLILMSTAGMFSQSGNNSICEDILCQMFPKTNIWNTPVDELPLDPNSATYINTIGASKNLHPDFGSGVWNGAPIGIPYILVPGNQKKVKVTFTYPDESDPGPYPVPANAPIEGGASSTGDRHILIVDKDNCLLYELYSSYPNPDGTWNAGSGAVFDLNSNNLRPDTWTSADAAGLPILPGLVRYDEVAKGEINHAIRFTVPKTQRSYIWPARHYASSITDKSYPPMGIRFRLKKNIDISGYSTEVQVILKAMKKYGIILADNGSAWFFSGVPDSRWNDDDLNKMKALVGSDFEAVDESSLQVSANSGVAKQAKNDIAITDIKAQFCPGTVSSVSFQVNSVFSAGNIFTAQLSNASRDFSNPIIIGSLNSTNSGKINIAIPRNITAGTGYRIRIVSTNPSLVGLDNGSDISLLALPAATINGKKSTFKNSVETYTAANSADFYSWTVINGTINGSTTGNNVNVTWGNSDSGSVKLNETNSDGCTGSSTINVSLSVSSVQDISGDKSLSLKIIPNPVNDFAKIQFSIPENTNVTLKFIDLQGRDIVTLLNAEQRERGLNSVEFETERLEPGIYYCSLIAGSYSRTMKFAVVR